MRPARKGPETAARARLLQVTAHGFNEAGPQGAGNGTDAEAGRAMLIELQ